MMFIYTRRESHRWANTHISIAVKQIDFGKRVERPVRRRWFGIFLGEPKRRNGETIKQICHKNG